jgi:hypothetical protein
MREYKLIDTIQRGGLTLRVEQGGNEYLGFTVRVRAYPIQGGQELGGRESIRYYLTGETWEKTRAREIEDSITFLRTHLKK